MPSANAVGNFLSISHYLNDLIIDFCVFFINIDDIHSHKYTYLWDTHTAIDSIIVVAVFPSFDREGRKIDNQS